MLGIARHSQYAGWGQTALRPSFDNTSTITKTLTPGGFSFLIDGFGRNWEVNTSGSTIDITGLTSVSGYHDYKSLMSVTFYLPFPSGLSDGYYGIIMAVEAAYDGYSDPSNAGKTNSNQQFIIDIVSGQFRFATGWDTGGPPYLTLPGPYTDWTNKWLTIVYATTDDHTDFANYSANTTPPSGYDNIYDRAAIYQSETAELITYADNTSTTEFQGGRVALSDFTSNTVYLSSAQDPDYIRITGFGGGGEEYRLSSFFYSLGQTIDPAGIQPGDLSSTLLTSHPNPVAFTNGTALVKCGLVEYEELTPSVNLNYFIEENAGKFSESNGRVIEISTDATDFQSGISTTIIPKDKT